jgi:GNAT superfamily N-acetyltransferase
LTYVIRKANKNDSQHIGELFKKLGIDQMSRDKYFTDSLENLKISNDEIFNIISNPNSIIYVAEIDNKIIGYIEAWFHKKDFNFFIDDYVYILHMFVDDNYRSYKVMYELHKSIENWTIKKKIKYIEADIFEFNKKVQKIAEYLGYLSYRRRYVKDIISSKEE